VKRSLIGLAVVACCVVPAAQSSTPPTTRAVGLGGVPPLPVLSFRSPGGLKLAKEAVAFIAPTLKAKFNDPPRDAGCCAADITKVDVQQKNGVLKFQVMTNNANNLRGDEFFGVYFDTDQNPATGASGFEYVLVILGRSSCGGTACAFLLGWTGTTFTIVPATGTWLWKAGPTFDFLLSDIGSPPAFDFVMYTQRGSIPGDLAPNPRRLDVPADGLTSQRSSPASS
jgi:hypothetical protein